MILAAGVALAACSSNSRQNYNLTLQLPEGINEGTVYLVNFDTDERLDSAIINGDSIVFNGTVDAPIFASLMLQGERPMPLGYFVLEDGDIAVKDYVATGTKYNEISNSVTNGLRERLSAFDKLYSNVPQDSITDEQRQAIADAYEAYCDSALMANIDNPVGYFLLLQRAGNMQLAELEQLIAEHPSVGEYARIQKQLEFARNKAATMPGNKFVDFTIENNGTKQSLSDYAGKGKPVIVDFWASWCGPCIRETKVLKELLEEYGPQGLEVLGVAVWDEPENTQRAIEQHQLPWQQIMNAQNVPTDLYGIVGIPCIMLIAPDGTILSRDKQEDELRADVKAMMKGTLTPESVKAAQAE